MKYHLIILIFGISTCLAVAQPIATVTGTYSGPVGGLYTYSYSITNDTTSPENIWEFWVYPTVPFTNVSQITDPSGWVIWDYFTDWSSFIQWFSIDPSYDITPGISLSGFSYQSAGPPGTISYDAGGSDPTTGWSTGNYASGTTVGATPEPATFLFLLTGVSGVLVHLRRKRS